MFYVHDSKVILSLNNPYNNEINFHENIKLRCGKAS